MSMDVAMKPQAALRQPSRSELDPAGKLQCRRANRGTAEKQLSSFQKIAADAPDHTHGTIRTIAHVKPIVRCACGDLWNSPAGYTTSSSSSPAREIIPTAPEY